MRLFLILQLVSLLFFQTASCGREDADPVVSWKGPNDRLELVFFYKKNVSYEEKQFFEDYVLHTPHPEGKGFNSREGVVGELSVRNSGYDGRAIEFHSNATPEQRKKLKTAIQSSPIIHRIYENAVPNEINDLDQPSAEIFNFGPDKFTSIVFFFKRETRTEQKEAFENAVIAKPHPEGKGHNLPDGVALSYFIRNGDYEGYGLTFSTDATPEQRERLKKAIKESPIVYKVYEDVVPNEIKDL